MYIVGVQIDTMHGSSTRRLRQHCDCAGGGVPTGSARAITMFVTVFATSSLAPAVHQGSGPPSHLPLRLEMTTMSHSQVSWNISTVGRRDAMLTNFRQYSGLTFRYQGMHQMHVVQEDKLPWGTTWDEFEAPGSCWSFTYALNASSSFRFWGVTRRPNGSREQMAPGGECDDVRILTRHPQRGEAATMRAVQRPGV